jgi:hypothetical protein
MKYFIREAFSRKVNGKIDDNLKKCLRDLVAQCKKRFPSGDWAKGEIPTQEEYEEKGRYYEGQVLCFSQQSEENLGSEPPIVPSYEVDGFQFCSGYAEAAALCKGKTKDELREKRSIAQFEVCKCYHFTPNGDGKPSDRTAYTQQGIQIIEKELNGGSDAVNFQKIMVGLLCLYYFELFYCDSEFSFLDKCPPVIKDREVRRKVDLMDYGLLPPLVLSMCSVLLHSSVSGNTAGSFDAALLAKFFNANILMFTTNCHRMVFYGGKNGSYHVPENIPEDTFFILHNGAHFQPFVKRS